MKGITQIFRKELDRIFKDKKLVFSVFILPIVVMVGIMTLVSNMSTRMMETIDQHQSVVYLINAPEGFEAFLQAADTRTVIHTDGVQESILTGIKSGDIDLLIVFPDNFLEQIQTFQAGAEIPQVKTFYNPSENFSAAAFHTISGSILEAYRLQLLAERVGDMSMLTVFTVNSDNPDMIVQDDTRAAGQMIGTMLPYFITILLFAGAMGIGTDMVAGEKERGTMASLLVAPIKRSSIVLGKVFSLMTISGISSIIYVIGMILFMPNMFGGTQGTDLGFNITFTPVQILQLALILVSLAFLYATIIVLVSVFAKTIKEASTYIVPAYMAILVLGLITMFNTGTPDTIYYFIPFYNTNIALQGILTQDITALQIGITLGVTLILGAGMILAIAKAFESEKVMAI